MNHVFSNNTKILFYPIKIQLEHKSEVNSIYLIISIICRFFGCWIVFSTPIMFGILLISARPTGEFHGSMPLFLGAFTLISVVLIGFGFVLFKKRKQWVHNSKMTYGKIVEISKRYSRDDHSGRFPIYFPIVSYYVNGLEFRREADKGLAKTCEIGQEIPVRYLSENPYEASLAENTVPGLNPSIFFVMGLLMLASAIILLILKA
ncbi:MAG: hypothetical protein RL408_1137 [Bacteroidota bacterium]